MIAYIKEIVNSIKRQITKFYLILANVLLVVFAIWFTNIGILPFSKMGDFAFFIVLSLLLAIYRPGWTFVLFIGSLVLENINLAPDGFPLGIRPFQLLGAVTFLGVFVQYFSKRLPFSFPKFHWADGLLVLFSVAGFVSALFSAQKGLSLKQAIVALSFVFLYFLTRIYIQSLDDLKRILPFAISSGFVVAIYSIWQNIRFKLGVNPFEIMPGRPNATFSEPDWLGIYLVFLVSILYSIIYYLNKKSSVRKNLSLVTCHLSLVPIIVALVLTVSRSAWIGAIIVILGFLKVTLLGGSLKFSNWQLKNASVAFLNISATFIFSLSVIYIFGLTSFQLGSRAQSTGGLQKITIACTLEHGIVPEKINSVTDLAPLGCKHINLEDIEKEKMLGNFIAETSRPDPNVGIRARIYAQSLGQIKTNPIFGIGWGSISSILGKDENGNGLNASNIFLETYLGAGMLGFTSLVILFVYIFIKGVKLYFSKDIKMHSMAVALLLAWGAVVIPNLFNSGIFLGFVWVYLGVAISLLSSKRE
jgi:hypothetical protein